MPCSGIITFSTAKKMEDNVHLCQSAFYLILELKLHKIPIPNRTKFGLDQIYTPRMYQV